MNFGILNKKESNKILDEIKENFGIKKIELDYGFIKNDDKIYLITKDLGRIDFKKLKINDIGLYFCALSKGGISLSIEATQMIGNKAAKNVVEIFDEEVKYWFNGESLVRKNLSGMVIIKNKNDFLGCGYAKDGLIINYIPKERRVKELIL